MHRWTPVSSTVPWSTSTSQEVFHVDTNLPRLEFLICTFVNKRVGRCLATQSKVPAGSLVSISHFVAFLVRDSSKLWAGSSSVPLFQTNAD